MVMRKDNALQMSHLMRNASYIPLYAQWDIAAHANDIFGYITSIFKRTWNEGGYAYTYDALNRLESAVFTPAEGLADRPGIERGRIPDFSVYYCYDLRGNMTNVVRYGVVDAVSDFDRVETFGTLDELACSYDGNRLSNVTAITEALPFDGVTGLHADGEFELAYNDAGDMVSDASRGLLHTRWNADGHPMQYDLEGGHRQTLGWDAFGNHLYTSYETSVAPVSTGALPGRTRRTSVRAYSGDGHVLRGGAGNSKADTLEMLRFAGGYFDADLVPHYYVTDYLGSNIAVIRSDGILVQSATYYPYGEPHRDPAADAGFDIAGPDLPMSATTSNTATASTSSNPYLYGGKEYVRRDGLREYVYGARMFVSSETRFNSMDRLCEKHPDQSPYLFCGGNPIRYVDPTGNEWKYVSDESAEEYNTFVWVDAKDAYDKDGNLLPDHYVQAISFSANGANGEFNPENNYNMSTSTATVYKADGSTEKFDACTNPSNPDKYATVPAGRYEAKVGLHKGSYTALRMGDVGTKSFAANTIELGEPNPSNKKTTKAAGINIHKPGRNNLTGMTKSKKPVSMGCFLIDQNKWTKFISIFTAYHDKLVGIIVNR